MPKDLIKVEIGQEWTHYTWVKHGGSCVIDKISYQASGKVYLRVTLQESNIIPSRDGPYLDSEDHPEYYSSWTYLGTPVRCEYCKEFCRQQCIKGLSLC